MSLLMQALKKAERAKQNHLVEDEPAKPSEELDQVLSLAPQEPSFTAPAAPKADAGLSLESYDNPALSLSPLPDEPVAARHEPVAPASAPVSSPAPTQPPSPAPLSSHAPTPAADTEHAATARAAPAGAASAVPPRPRAQPADANRAAGGRAPARRAAPARRPRSIDAQTLRLGVLTGIAVLIAAAFGTWYWRAVAAPGEGSRLPMVPMPPQNAAPADNGGLIVAPPAADTGAAMPANAAQVPAAAAAAPVSMQPALQAASQPTPQAAPTAVAPAAAAVPAPPRTSASYVPRNPATAHLSPEALAAMARFGGPPALPVPTVGPGSAQEAARQRAQAGADPTLHRYVPPGAPPATAQAAMAGAAAPPPYQDQAPSAPPDTVVGNGDIHLARSDRGAMVNPALQGAYAAFNSGDLGGARQYYLSVQRSDPNNRDALLGLAAIALRENQPGQAASSYLRLLELDPNDGEAVSGLIGLRHGDPEQSESRLKVILQRNPEAGPVLFALGNLVAQQGRWSEAQQIYFRAYSANPGNADYAFNVAIGLDRLNQPKLAIGYYQRALALSTNNPGSFDRAAARRRLHELGAASASTPASTPPAVLP